MPNRADWQDSGGYGGYGSEHYPGTDATRFGEMGGRDAYRPEQSNVPYDPDYDQWRREQLRGLDEDYRNWREERYKKFSDEFSSWRSNRPAKSGSDPTSPSSSATQQGISKSSIKE